MGFPLMRNMVVVRKDPIEPLRRSVGFVKFA